MDDRFVTLPANLAAFLEPLVQATAPPETLRLAAVVAALTEPPDDRDGDDGVRLVLIERAPSLRTHAGQLGFPGGKPEPIDRSLWETARREAEEEVGLPAGIEPLGCLSAVQIPTGFYVVPFVVYVPAPWTPSVVCREEVSRVLTPSLTTLLDPKIHRVTGTREVQGQRYPMHRFEIHDPPLWGATAMMVWDLLERIRRAHAAHD